MHSEQRTEDIDNVFTMLVTKLKERLQSKDCSDRDMIVALRFLKDYEVERLPEAGSGVPGDVPFPISGTG